MLTRHRPTVEGRPARTTSKAVFVLGCSCQAFSKAFVLDVTGDAAHVATVQLRMLESLTGHLMQATSDGFCLGDVPALAALVRQACAAIVRPGATVTSVHDWEEVEAAYYCRCAARCDDVASHAVDAVAALSDAERAILSLLVHGGLPDAVPASLIDAIQAPRPCVLHALKLLLQCPGPERRTIWYHVDNRLAAEVTPP